MKVLFESLSQFCIFWSEILGLNTSQSGDSKSVTRLYLDRLRLILLYSYFKKTQIGHSEFLSQNQR